jgi:hypothetical protein
VEPRASSGGSSSEQALGPDHPHIGIRRNNLGKVLRELGDLAGARLEYERALQISERALTTSRPGQSVSCSMTY